METRDLRTEFTKETKTRFNTEWVAYNDYVDWLEQRLVKLLTIPVVSGSYYWVKLMTDDKHEPAIAINLLGEMNFQFFNGVAVPCDKVNDYSECNYR